MEYHLPALLNETIEGLNIKPNGVYIDVTFGGGGHSRAILNKLTTGKLIAFDQDEDAKANVPDNSRIIFIHGNFRYMKNYLKYLHIEKVDGIVADLGISSHQIDIKERGFSFQNDTKIDMRMNKNASKDACKVLNNYTEEELSNIFFNYGEIKNARQLAHAVTLFRNNTAITTVSDFMKAIENCIPKFDSYKYLAKVFQAIRIEVNNEIECLKELLKQSNEVLKIGGRIAIISYHSLEDRLVKNFFKTGNFEGIEQKDLYGNTFRPMKAVNKQVITPSEDEIKKNNRARSAKLRIAEKIEL